MTTIRQIIVDAYGETGIVGLGDEPDAAQFALGLRRLNALYSSLFGNELGEPLISVSYGDNGLVNSYGKAGDSASEIKSRYVPANARLILNLENADTVYLAPNPMDGTRLGVIDNSGNLATYNFTIDANGRKIESNNTLVLSVNSTNKEWFYREDLGAWVLISELEASDQSPLPKEFDDLLVTLLAFRINPRFGAETPPEMSEALRRIQKQFKARYRQKHSVDSEIGLYRLTSNYPYYWLSNTQNFNLGRP